MKTAPEKKKVTTLDLDFFLLFSPKDTLSLLLERKAMGESETEREISTGCLLTCTSRGDGTYNLGMCPERELLELHPWPFGLWDDTQPTEPYQPGLGLDFYGGLAGSNTLHTLSSDLSCLYNKALPPSLARLLRILRKTSKASVLFLFFVPINSLHLSDITH